MEIEEATCVCPRGQLICHHMAALLLFGKDNVSSTDVECQWSKRVVTEGDVEPVENLYPVKHHRSTQRLPTDAEKHKFLSSLAAYGGTVGFSWLLKPEPVPPKNLIPDVEELIFSKKFIDAVNKTEFLTDALKIDDGKVNEIEEATRGQSDNANWLKCRKHRLTASRFGMVVKAIKRNKYPPSLFKQLSGNIN